MKATLDSLLNLTFGSSFSTAILCWGAVSARVGTALWIAPFFGGRLLNPLVKSALILLFTFIVAPSLQSQAINLAAQSNFIITATLLKEALLGTALGFVISAVFWATQTAGQLIDTTRGANLSEVLVPQNQTRVSPLADLLFQFSIVLFLMLGGHRIFLQTLVMSYEQLPLDFFPTTAGLGAFAFFCCRLTAQLLTLAIVLCAPVVAALFVADVALGLINRFAPQWNVFFMAMPLKALLGILFLALLISSQSDILPGSFNEALGQITQTLRLLSGHPKE